MKILQVTPVFTPSKFGGVKVVSYSLAKALAKGGHEVTVYTTDAEVGYSRLKNVQDIRNMDGFSVRYFKNTSNLLAFKYRLFLPMGMTLAAKKKLGSFDIIHLHDFRSFQSTIAHYYAKKYGVPYVLDTHGSLPRMHGKRGGKLLIKWLFDVIFGYRILRDASKVIAETKVGVNEYKKFGVNEDKIVLIPPPFPVEEFSQLPSPGLFRRKFNLKDKRIVMFLGRIHWIKGLDFLVESFSQLAQYRSDVILVVVGPDDGYKSTLERLINELSLSDKVLFTGFLGGEEKLAALVDADVVVQTSKYEQGTGVPFEAILCNTPIIVGSNSGAGENVKKIDAGYLVEYGNKSQLRDILQDILDNPAEAKSKTQKAKEYIKANLSLAKEIEKYVKLYQEVIERCKK